jgi:hypothetical protein
MLRREKFRLISGIPTFKKNSLERTQSPLSSPPMKRAAEKQSEDSL